MNDQLILEIVEQIGGLLYKRLQGELSEIDQIRLDNWFDQQSPETRDFFDHSTNWDQIIATVNVMYSFDMHKAFADIQKKIDADAATIVPIGINQSRMISSFKIKMWIAAAIVIIVAGVFIFHEYGRKVKIREFAEQKSKYHNDVKPGGEKAILTLADGRKIVLDSLANGELAIQGNSKVVKLADGKISYDRGGKDETVTLFNTISTPRGGIYRVILPDGSIVWLNTKSSIRFPTSFNGKERKVEVDGEAYFSVTKNSSMPFIVAVSPLHAGSPLEVDVLGTEFNIRAYGDEADLRTTLVAGAINVKSEKQQIILKAGQQVYIANKAVAALHLVDSVDVEEVAAWKNGLFQFHNASIEEVMTRAARWYDIDVIYQGHSNKHFNGTIPLHVNISTLLEILASTGLVHFTVEGKTVTVIR